MALRILLIRFLVILMILIPIGISNQSLLVDTDSRSETNDQSTLAEDVTITKNEDWILQGWPGNGTLLSPFIIDGFAGNNIHISNSTNWFVILSARVRNLVSFNDVTNGRIEHSDFQNLSIYRSMKTVICSNTWDARSITVDSSTEIDITNNRIQVDQYDYSFGIMICFSSNIRISNNTVIGHYTGISIRNSVNCSLKQNNITLCGRVIWITPANVEFGEGEFVASQSEWKTVYGEAINLENCAGTEICSNRVVENNGRSLVVLSCNSTTIRHNDISMNGASLQIRNCMIFNITDNSIAQGIAIESSWGGTVMSNIFADFGLSLQGNLNQLLLSVSNNSGNGLPLVFLANTQLGILQSQTAFQIILVNCTSFVVQDVVVAGYSGIEVLFSEYCRIEGAECQSITVRSSLMTLVQNSRIDSGDGIIIDSSPKTQVKNNSLTRGVAVKNQSNETMIADNLFRSAYMSAIQIDSTSSQALIKGNDIRECGRPQWLYPYYSYNAIHVDGDNCTIINNIVVDNLQRGIILGGKNNRVYHNVMARNKMGNAWDYGTNNTWDDNVSRGNAWGDYIGIGYYYIPGSAGSVDRFPTLSSEFMEQSVFSAWAVVVGVSATFAILVGLAVYSRLRKANHTNGIVECKRVGLG